MRSAELKKARQLDRLRDAVDHAFAVRVAVRLAAVADDAGERDALLTLADLALSTFGRDLDQLLGELDGRRTGQFDDGGEL